MAKRSAGASRGARVIPVRYFRNECPIVERMVRDAGVPASEIDPYRPGGAENPGRDVYAWLKFWRQLQRLHAAGASGSRGYDAPGESEAEAIIADGLANAPVAVPTGLESPPSVYVYPKSWWALRRIAEIDARLQWLAVRTERLAMHRYAEERDVIERALRESDYQQALIVWAITTPGPGMPFDAGGHEAPDPPAWILTIDALVLAALMRAHHDVNGRRLAALSALVDPASDGERPSWAAFFAAAAQRTHRDADLLMRDRSLVSVLAQVAIAADAEAQAYERAKRNATAGQE